VKKSETVLPLTFAVGALGTVAAMMLAPSAMADPDAPAPPMPVPGPALPGPALPGPADQSVTAQAAPGDPAAQPDPDAPPAPPAEVQHLSSPQNLPPGYTLDQGQADPGEGRNLSYLRDLFHAYQTQEIDGKGALLLLTQRPLDPNSMSTNGMPNGPIAPPGTPPPLGPGPDAPAADAPPADGPPPGPVLPGLAPPSP
jgi:hypothetical protein